MGLVNLATVLPFSLVSLSLSSPSSPSFSSHTRQIFGPCILVSKDSNPLSMAEDMALANVTLSFMMQKFDIIFVRRKTKKQKRNNRNSCTVFSLTFLLL